MFVSAFRNVNSNVDRAVGASLAWRIVESGRPRPVEKRHGGVASPPRDCFTPDSALRLPKTAGFAGHSDQALRTWSILVASQCPVEPYVGKTDLLQPVLQFLP